MMGFRMPTIPSVSSGRAHKERERQTVAGASRRLTRHREASSIAIDVGANQFPQLPEPRHSPEQDGGYRATNHTDRQEYAQDRLSAGRKNYSTVSRDPRHRL